ncbi:MAG: Maltooligosyl trehalose synthase [Planctomycetes bacterium ADurb.Bin401]|nr:MAG: Maltooligosyl trehalose synthase [Planctomycetes bacterium ADurb.Bin401]
MKGGYEERLVSFIEKIPNDEEFVRSLEWFIGQINRAAMISSLSQTLIKYTAPGIPDLYQGTELWDISLVDPDNRRPVDYQLRKNIFFEMENIDCKRALEEMESGLVKMYVIYHCLKVRRENVEAFDVKGSYEPMSISGAKGENAVAFKRGGKIAAVAPRLLISAGDDWQDTAVELGGGKWMNEFTKQIFEGRAEMKNLLNDFPLALLVKEK